MAYKSEREWKDIDKASKIVMGIFLIAFLGISYGLIKENDLRQIQQKMIKTEITR